MTLLLLLFSSAILAAYLVTRFTRIKPKMEIPTVDEPLLPASPLADLGYDTVQVATLLTSSHQKLDISSPRDLFMIYLIAPTDQPYLGYELIQTLLATGLRHGDKNIFHYHDNQGTILFSVSQANESGSFDLDKIGNIACQGLLFFMKPQVTSADFAMEKMLAIASQLAEELGGKLEDAHHQLLTEQTIAHYRNKCTVAE